MWNIIIGGKICDRTCRNANSKVLVLENMFREWCSSPTITCKHVSCTHVYIYPWVDFMGSMTKCAMCSYRISSAALPTVTMGVGLIRDV